MSGMLLCKQHTPTTLRLHSRAQFRSQKMAEPRKQQSPFSLLDLPDAAIDIAVAKMARTDKPNFMAACRKAARMTMANGLTLKLTKHSKFAGIKKVLDAFPTNITLEIMCPPNGDKDAQPNYRRPVSAMAMFMGMVPNQFINHLASTCRCEGITKVTIQGQLIKCLVPPFVAISCPNLTHFSIIRSANTTDFFTSLVEEAVPLILCSKLKELELLGTKPYSTSVPVLPPAYHSTAELCQNLPNIDTLIMSAESAVLINAFATNLTRLKVGQTSRSTKVAMHRCSRLSHLSVPRMILPSNATALTVFELTDELRDDDLLLLLTLTSLTTLSVESIANIQQDWKSHACSWRELHITNLEFTSLAKLNLHSIKVLSIGPDPIVYLPDPDVPDSFAALQRAVDNLSGVGKIQLRSATDNAVASYGECGTICWFINSEEINDEEAAELFALAAQQVDSARVCRFQYMDPGPLLLLACVGWGQAFVESVCFGSEYDLKQFEWQALQDLQKLNTVVFWSKHKQANELQQTMDLFQLSALTCTAAQQYVIPSGKHLCIEYGVSDFVEDRRVGDAVNCQTPCDLVQAAQQDLSSNIKATLPIGSRLVSIDFCSMEGNKLYTGYGGDCQAKAFWAVVVAPLNPTAEALT